MAQTKNYIARQQLKIMLVQLMGALLSLLVYWWYDEKALIPLLYSVFIGMCYSIMLYLGMVLFDYLGKESPEYGTAVLAAFAVLRFVVTGILLGIGFKFWNEAPLALIVPFIAVLLTPMLLVPFKKRLTD